MQRLPALDALRFASALWVMWAHCLIWGGYEGFIPNAKMAVAIFMVLSGYLMALTAADFAQPREWTRFYLRRFFRIAPLYYLVLIFVAASPWVRDGLTAWHKFPPGSIYSPERADFSFANIALHLSFLFGLDKDAATSTLLPDWSLSLEMQFYAAFPAIWLAVSRWGASRVCVALAAISLPFWVWQRSLWHDPSHLLLQLPYFLAGIMVFEARKAAAFLPLALAFAAFEMPYGHLQTLAPIAAVAMIFACDRWPQKWLAIPAVALGADVSYGIYLVHGPLIAAGAGMPLWLLLPFVTVSSLAVSLVLYRCIERPGVAVGQKMARALRRPQVG